MVFNQKAAPTSNNKLKTTVEDYFFSRQKELILDLVAPHAGERLLDVGCGTGNHLQIFKEKWCSVTGIDSSRTKLEEARAKLGEGADLHYGNAEDLPFSDNEFDIVTMINSLEVTHDPQKAITEAIRVCRNRLFIGFVNKNSFVGTRQGLKEIFGFPLAEDIRFFSKAEVRNMARKLIGAPPVKWGSVIYFPTIVYDVFAELEELIPMAKNPFGAFFGLTFPIKYTYRTAENPIVEAFHLKNKSASTATAPEAVRGMLRGVDK